MGAYVGAFVTAIGHYEGLVKRYRCQFGKGYFTMKNVAIVLTLTNLLLGIAVAAERPSDAELQAFKVYHHAVYLVTTAEQAGGTNKLHHTTELPTEGTDPVADFMYLDRHPQLFFFLFILAVPFSSRS